MKCPCCKSHNTHSVGLGHRCGCGNVWLVQGEPIPEAVRIPNPELEREDTS